MNERDFYLAAYDIAEPRRLAAALQTVRAYATGGQKSVHECFLTAGERNDMTHQMSLLIDEETDRFLLLRLDPRARIHVLGRATPPADPGYFYLG